MTVEISVVIPTRNRAAILDSALGALSDDLADIPAEIIVVVDGSTDSSEVVLRRWTEHLPLRWCRQTNLGPAAARNRGISLASADLILFLGDDIIAKPGLISAHLEFHRQHPDRESAMLGRIMWDPVIRPTPLMHWLENHGMQFDYANLSPRHPANFYHFYTSNVSVKRTLVEAVGGFDEQFRDALFEDVDLGYRLQRAGMRLIYCPDAVGHHRHPTSFHDTVIRERRKRAIRPLLLSKPVGLAIFPDGLPLLHQERVHNRFMRHVQRHACTPLRWMADSRMPLPPKVYYKLLELFT